MRPTPRAFGVAVVALVVLLTSAATAFGQGSFGPADADAPSAVGARHAFLIGIDEYQDKSFAPLRFAANDATELGAALADPSYGGFATVEIVVDGDLSASAIVDRLVEWGRGLAPEDLAVIYYSGHGTRWLDERNRSQVFLAAEDTRRDDPVTTGLPLRSMQELIEALPASRRVLVVDACFTGDGKVTEGDAEAAARAVIDEKLPFSERVADKEAQLYATTYGRPALESEALEHGVYTAHLIAALTEQFDAADLNGDLVVSVSEAHDYARDRTIDSTSMLQIPMVFYRIVGREDLILSGDPGSRKRVEMAMVSAYEGPQQGLRLFVDGQEKGAFPRTVLVEPGPRKVEFRNLAGKIVESGRYSFRKEGVYSVGKLRDHINGGRHLVGVGYAHTWLPGEAFVSAEVPSAPGFEVSYTFRFPSRVPLVRRLGLAFDASVGFFSKEPSSDGSEAPPTTLLDIGFGPFIRLDLPFFVLSAQPRFALVNLFRSETRQPYLNWTFGAIGAKFGVGFRPVNRLSFQFQYSPMLFDASLQGGIESKMELMHRMVGTVVVGF